MAFYRLFGRISLSVILGWTLSACSDVDFAPYYPDDQSRMSGQFYSEKFTQGFVSKKLDILFVVDNSGSMADEQQKLGERIASFIDTLYDVDWQIGITTTDVSDGPQGLKGSLLHFKGTNSYILKPKTANAMELFRSTIVREESISCTNDCGSGDEQPLRAAIMAMDKHKTDNKGFFRTGADIGLLILSDEDERSTGGANATKPEEVLDKMNDLWGDEKRLLTYGMIIKPGDTQCYNMQFGQGRYGTFVDRLATLTNGLTGSICDNDYAPTLGLIADHARRLLDYVQLKFRPEFETVEVKFTPAHTTDWRVEGRRVYFTNPPPDNTVIDIGYIVK